MYVGLGSGSRFPTISEVFAGILDSRTEVLYILSPKHLPRVDNKDTRKKILVEGTNFPLIPRLVASVSYEK